MFKNKDGSYNKVQILLISLIALISIGLIITSIAPRDLSQDIDPLFIIGGLVFLCAFVLAGFIISKFIIRKKQISQLETATQTKKDVVSLHSSQSNDIKFIKKTKIFEEVKHNNKNKEIFGDIVTVNKQPSQTHNFHFPITGIITLVIGSVSFFIAATVINNLMASLPQIQNGNSVWSTTTTNITQAFSIAGLMLPLIGLIIIITSILQISKH